MSTIITYLVIAAAGGFAHAYGLPKLKVLYKKFRDSRDVEALLAKVVAEEEAAKSDVKDDISFAEFKAKAMGESYARLKAQADASMLAEYEKFKATAKATVEDPLIAAMKAGVIIGKVV